MGGENYMDLEKIKKKGGGWWGGASLQFEKKKRTPQRMQIRQQTVLAKKGKNPPIVKSRANRVRLERGL